MDLGKGWAENWDVFVEIGAAASVFTRLIRQVVPKALEAKEGFRRFLHFIPVFCAALLLGVLSLFPLGGLIVLHSVTVGGMSGNFRDIFVAMISRLSAGTKVTEAKASVVEDVAKVIEGKKPDATGKPTAPLAPPKLPPTLPEQDQDEKGS